MTDASGLRPSDASGVPARDQSVFVQALGLALDPAWRRRREPDRAIDAQALLTAEACTTAAGVRTLTCSTIGLEPGVEILLLRLAPSVDALEEAGSRLHREGLGGWLSVRRSFIGRIAPSQYVKKATDQERSLLDGHPKRYLVVYPFTKSGDWYLLGREARQGIMNEHMRVGHGYPQVRQLLAYSFGLDDQDFVVAYDTDDLDAFGDLVRELRGTESRRSTVSDRPLLLGVRRSWPEILAALGAPPVAAPA